MLTRTAYLKRDQQDRHGARGRRSRRCATRSAAALDRVKTLERRAADEVAAAGGRAGADRRRSARRPQARAAEARPSRGRSPAVCARHAALPHLRVDRRGAALQAATGQGGNAGDTVHQWFDGFTIPKYDRDVRVGRQLQGRQPGQRRRRRLPVLPETYKGLGGKYDAPQLAPKSEQDQLAAKLWNDGAGRAATGSARVAPSFPPFVRLGRAARRSLVARPIVSSDQQLTLDVELAVGARAVAVARHHLDVVDRAALRHADLARRVDRTRRRARSSPGRSTVRRPWRT